MRGKDIGSEIDRNFPSKMFPSKKKVFVIFKAPAVSIIARTISTDASLITEKLVKIFFADFFLPVIISCQVWCYFGSYFKVLELYDSESNSNPTLYLKFKSKIFLDI